jgi:flagellar biogenesis protein FliO
MNQKQKFRFIAEFRLNVWATAVMGWLVFVSLSTLPSYGQDPLFEPASPGPAERNPNSHWDLPSSVGQAGFSPTANGSWPEQPVSFESKIEAVRQQSQTDTPNASLQTGSLTTAIGWAKDFLVNQATHAFDATGSQPAGNSSINLPKMLASLALVLGGYFGFVWLVRTISPASNTQLPQSVVQVLGRTPFGPKQNLQLVKLGSKLVLLLHGPEGAHPIGEITDPAEVEKLLCQCQSRSSGRSPQTSAIPDSSRSSQQQSESLSPGLVNILRSIENAAKQNGNSVFEA